MAKQGKLLPFFLVATSGQVQSYASSIAHRLTLTDFWLIVIAILACLAAHDSDLCLRNCRLVSASRYNISQFPFQSQYTASGFSGLGFKSVTAKNEEIFDQVCGRWAESNWLCSVTWNHGNWSVSALPESVSQSPVRNGCLGNRTDHEQCRDGHPAFETVSAVIAVLGQE
ncbi:hypothetical protein BaRGS_00031558 [Batillaria attramentaria]|uniref:Uncharacterized protein n=1 Tax=Batillaria attramentaria TaxID=370345 RepID=A0ABD0JQ20_9CAEN